MYRTINNSAGEATGRTRISLAVFVYFAIALLISGSLQPLCAQTPSEEYKVKAAFIFHFAQLVEWPSGAVDQTLHLCVFDDEPHHQELQTILEGKLIGTRVLRVHLLGQAQDFQVCNIFFLSRDENRRQAAVLRSLRSLPVLTVGESDNFISEGGMIRFHLDGDKIRFDINREDADASHLKISSRLLLLATSVTLGNGSDRRR